MSLEAIAGLALTAVAAWWLGSAIVNAFRRRA